jgi:hypothetical protein
MTSLNILSIDVKERDFVLTLISCLHKIFSKYFYNWGPLLVAQWLRYCATNLKVAGSIPDGVTEIFL